MITSTSNQQVKELQKLQKSSKYRSQRGLFVVEGWRIFEEMPIDLIEKVYVKEEDIDKLDDEIKVLAELVSKPVLKAMSCEVTSQGIIGLIRIPSVENDLASVENPLMVALDCVQDPGNLGTIIRTAEAAGVHKLVLSKGTVDLYNPKVVKATMGAILRMPIEKDVDLASFIKKETLNGTSFYAAHLKGEKQHFQMDYVKATCFLMGNEGSGLRDEIADLATDYIKIPMTPKAESLNVAMATGILIYEAIRQRY